MDTQFNGPVSVGLIDFDGTGAVLSGTLFDQRQGRRGHLQRAEP